MKNKKKFDVVLNFPCRLIDHSMFITCFSIDSEILGPSLKAIL